MKPAWLTEAERYIGVEEIPGGAHHPKIKEWWDMLGVKFNNDENDWCAIFVGAMLETVGYKSARAQKSRTYLTFGKKLTKPQLGCVVVFWRETKDSAFGHVAFYLGEDENSIKILGGNQDNKVSVENRSKKYLLGYRWPTQKFSFFEKLARWFAGLFRRIFGGAS